MERARHQSRRSAVGRAGRGRRPVRRSPRRSTRSTRRWRPCSPRPQDQYNTLTAAGGQVSQYASQIASLNTADQPADRRPARAQRPARSARRAAGQALGMAQISVTDHSDGTVTVDFGDAGLAAGLGHHRQLAPDADRQHARRPARRAARASPAPRARSGRCARRWTASPARWSPPSTACSRPRVPSSAATTAGTIAVAATASTVDAPPARRARATSPRRSPPSRAAPPDQAFSAFVGQLGNAVSSAQSRRPPPPAVLSADRQPAPERLRRLA